MNAKHLLAIFMVVAIQWQHLNGMDIYYPLPDLATQLLKNLSDILYDGYDLNVDYLKEMQKKHILEEFSWYISNYTNKVIDDEMNNTLTRIYELGNVSKKLGRDPWLCTEDENINIIRLHQYVATTKTDVESCLKKYQGRANDIEQDEHRDIYTALSTEIRDCYNNNEICLYRAYSKIHDRLLSTPFMFYKEASLDRVSLYTLQTNMSACSTDGLNFLSTKHRPLMDSIFNCVVSKFKPGG